MHNMYIYISGMIDEKLPMITCKRRNWMKRQWEVNLCFIFFSILKNYYNKINALFNEREGRIELATSFNLFRKKW